MVKVLEPTVFHLPSHPWTLLASLLPLALPVSILLSASVDLTLGTLSQWSHIVSLCVTGSVYLTQSFSRLPCAVAYGWVAITARTAHILPYIAYVSVSPALPLKLALSREFDHSDRKQDSDAKHLSMCLLTICASVTFGGRYSQFWSCLKSARFYFFFLRLLDCLFQILSPYQIYDLKIYHFVHMTFAIFISWSLIVYFSFSDPSLWCPIKEIIAKSDILKLWY